MKTVINTYLPFFPGFYESIYFNSDTEYYAIQEEKDYLENECGLQNIDADKFEFNYKEFEQDVCKSFIEAFKNYTPEFVEGLEFTGLYSPRFYNYDTDRIYCNIILSEDWKNEVRDFIRANYEDLKTRIKKDWSSYDGFISFISNDIQEWNSKLFEENDPLYIQIMLQYIMEAENNTSKYGTIEDKLYYDTMEDIYINSYLHYENEL